MKKFEYIKEASPSFGSLRQIPEMEEPMLVEGLELLNAAKKRQYQEELFRMPLYPLSVQPSEEWMQRKEYEEGVDFEKQILCPICKIPMQHNQSSHCAWLECPVCNSGARLAETDTLPCVAIPIEKKGDDLIASQNHPQPLDSVATLACTEGNSIEQKEIPILFSTLKEEILERHYKYLGKSGFRILPEENVYAAMEEYAEKLKDEVCNAGWDNETLTIENQRLKSRIRELEAKIEDYDNLERGSPD